MDHDRATRWAIPNDLYVTGWLERRENSRLTTPETTCFTVFEEMQLPRQAATYARSRADF